MIEEKFVPSFNLTELPVVSDTYKNFPSLLVLLVFCSVLGLAGLLADSGIAGNYFLPYLDAETSIPRTLLAGTQKQ